MKKMPVLKLQYNTDVPTINGDIYPKEVVREAFERYMSRKDIFKFGGLLRGAGTVEGKKVKTFDLVSIDIQDASL